MRFWGLGGCLALVISMDHPVIESLPRQQIGGVIFVDVFSLADSFPVLDLACRDFNIGKPLGPDPNPVLRSDVSNGMLFSSGSGYCRSCKIQR